MTQENPLYGARSHHAVMRRISGSRLGEFDEIVEGEFPITREVLVASIRKRLGEGTYELDLDMKIEHVLDRVLEDIGC